MTKKVVRNFSFSKRWGQKLFALCRVVNSAWNMPCSSLLPILVQHCSLTVSTIEVCYGSERMKSERFLLIFLWLSSYGQPDFRRRLSHIYFGWWLTAYISSRQTETWKDNECVHVRWCRRLNFDVVCSNGIIRLLPVVVRLLFKEADDQTTTYGVGGLFFSLSLSLWHSVSLSLCLSHICLYINLSVSLPQGMTS